MGDPAITSGEQETACPAARVVVRRPDPGSAVLTLSGEVGRDDAAILDRCLRREMDRGVTLVVVRLRLDGPPPEWLDEVLRAARARARRAGIGLRVVTRSACGRYGVEVPGA